jgi:WD40 repeat protein/serine/threonine protein kinase
MADSLADVKSIFGEAVEIRSPAEREAYLEQACGDNSRLRAEVESLLRAKQDGGRFLAGPGSAQGATADESISERPGTLIGPYKLLEQIGEGGFGVVFMAEQQRPVRRKVALKVLKPGMDTRQVVARFEAERQALALMDHPNIAHVFDGGTTGVASASGEWRENDKGAAALATHHSPLATTSGRPYFVMELVKGMPITEFSDQDRLSVRERLELFITVCQAVQHAHQKGIIHRDLKPSNVLVTLHDGTPVVKIIDFGIAKAIGQQLTEKTLFTNFAQLIGTPLYMSPEQAALSGLDVDTRSDIYALGVLLYELLTGSTPFEKERFKEAGYDEIRRIIREEEPPKPSTRISTLGQAATTVSTQRQSDPKRLSQLCRGELDWVVMKALEKDRNRRYESASAFAADVQRYLADEPVLACPPSAWYRFHKFARRNKRVFAIGSFAAAVLMVGVTGLAVSNVRISREKQQKEEALRQKEESLERERQTTYYALVALADREWSANNLRRMQQLLDECPKDLRGWEWNYLRRLPHKSLPPMYHASAALSAVFSPDGKWIASSSQDGFVKIWNAQTGQEIHSFQAHEDHARHLVFSPDGRRLATSRWGGTVKVWDFQTRRLIHTLTKPQGPQSGSSVAFSPDGRHLAYGGGYPDKFGEVTIWDATTGAELLTLDGHTQPVLDVAFSPDGQQLASGSRDGTVRVWEVDWAARTGRERLTLRSHRLKVMRVAFSLDGRCLASADGDWNTKADGEVRVWNAQTGDELRTLRGHITPVLSLAFSPDGWRLASAGGDQTVKIWDVATGQEALTLRGHLNWVRSVAFSPDGARLVTAGDDRTVRIWDARPPEEEPAEEVRTLRGHQGGVRSVAFHPSGRYLASAGDDAVVKVWDAHSGRELRTLPSRTGMVVHVEFNNRGDRLAMIRGSTGLGVYDTTTWQECLAVVGTGAMSFSRDDRYLGAGGGPFAVKVWDAVTGEELHCFHDHNWPIMNTAWHPDGRWVASAGYDGAVRLWDVTMGEEMQASPLRHAGGATSVAFSSDGRRLASGGYDRAVRIWDTATWRELRTVHDPIGGVQSVAWSPDGRHVAWGGTDSTIKLGNPDTGAVLQTLRGHTSWVESVVFSPDGQWIASGSLDGTVRIWNAPLFSGLPRPATRNPDK